MSPLDASAALAKGTTLTSAVLTPEAVLAQEEEVPIVPVAGELIVGALAFGLLCFILMKFVFPKMEQMFQARVEAIEGGLAKAEATQAEANTLLAQYKQQLDEVRIEASQIRDEARAEGHRILEEMRESAREESARIIARGDQQLAADRQRLITELRGDLGRLSVDLASRIVGESLADQASRSGTVERFLSNLDQFEGVGAVSGANAPGDETSGRSV